MCAISAHVDCHNRRRPLTIVRRSGSWPLLSLNTQMKKRNRVTSADIGMSPDTIRVWPSAVFECKYDHNVYVDTLFHMTL